MLLPGLHRVRQGDKIQLVVYSGSANVVYARARVLYDDGSEDDLGTPDFTTGTGRARQTVPYAQPVVRKHGVIVSAFVSTRTDGSKRGQTYAILAVENGVKLCYGYVYESHDVSLGEYLEPGPGGGEGWIHTVTGANPAGGAEVSITVPSKALWKLLSFSAVLVTTAEVANRVPRMVLDDGAVTNRRNYAQDDGGTPQTASQTFTHCWFEGVQGGAIHVTSAPTADTQNINLRGLIPENLYLPEGFRIRTLTSGLDVVDGGNGLDDYAAPIFQVEEWVKP